MRQRSRLGLTAALIFLMTGPGAGQEDDFAGRFVWRSDQERFGGYSAIEVSGDGTRFVAVTDRGLWSQGRFIRDDRSRITALATTRQKQLRDPEGKQLRGYSSDSEGLAIAPDGTAYVSFESPARVWRFSGGLEDVPTALPSPREFAGLRKNVGLEALAVGPGEVLYAIPEDWRSGQGFPVFRFRGGKWDVPFRIARRGAYLPVGADVGPDGRLYLLERAFSSPLTGFSSRIRRFDPAGDGIMQGEILLTTAPFRFGNLEGIAIWKDAAGALRATMIADDNFSRFLATEIVEFRLPD